MLGDVALSVRQLSVPRNDPFGVDLNDAGLRVVRAGEILGIAGVSGNGQQALMATLSGEDLRAQPRSIFLFGKDISRMSPRHRRHLGLNQRARRAPGPRRRAHHVAGPEHLADPHRCHRPGRLAGDERCGRHGVRADPALQGEGRRAASAGRSLSGGNLQKFIMGREIEAEPKVLLVSQPTWGVDVGAAAQIRGELLKLRDAGCAVLGGQ